jgi:hypothetical protein
MVRLPVHEVFLGMTTGAETGAELSKRQYEVYLMLKDRYSSPAWYLYSSQSFKKQLFYLNELKRPTY